MRRAVGLGLAALFCAGCSLLFQPDPGDIVRPRDAGTDGGTDAGSDGGVDGGDAGPFDAGPDPCVQALETSCSDGLDNDCDGVTDCDDLDCDSDGYCCDPGMGSPWSDLVTGYDRWTAHGWALPAADRVAFASGATGQVVHPTCAPLAFGMQLSVSVDVMRDGSEDDYASIVLAPVNVPRVGGDRTLLSDVALRVTGAGNAILERAGTVIARSSGSGASGAAMVLDLQPSVDSLGRPVLLVTAGVTFGGTFEVLADREVLMPLSDLRGSDAGCQPDGLYLAIEGHGNSVQVVSPVTATVGDCPNPTQFLADPGPLAGGPQLEDGSWRAGGAGEPTLFAAGSPTNRLDLLVDAAEVERSDEIFRFIDFAIGGAFVTASGWTSRISMDPSMDPRLLGPSPSSREPAFATGPGLRDPLSMLFAFARESPTRGVFEIHWGTLPLMRDATPSTSPFRHQQDEALAALTPSDVGCGSLRDPALIALDTSSPRVVLLFTCERDGEPDRIGAAAFDQNPDGDYVLDRSALDPALLGPEDFGSYARRGVFSPEVVVSGTDGTRSELRLWFLARDSAGRVRVAHAFGEVDPDGLPTFSAYPGNPILDPEDQLLGGPCPSGCTIDSLAVTATSGESPLGSTEPSYVFLVERTRFVGTGVEHQLIPLTQPRPSGG